MIQHAWAQMQSDPTRVDAFALDVRLTTLDPTELSNTRIVLPGSAVRKPKGAETACAAITNQFRKDITWWADSDTEIVAKAINQVWSSDGKQRSYLGGPA